MLAKVPSAVGRALKKARPGARKLMCNAAVLEEAPATMSVGSPAFDAGEPLPLRYTRDGESLSPPLEWRGVPRETKSLVLLIEDADSLSLEPLVHGMVLNLPSTDGGLAEGALSGDHASDVAHEFGRNSMLRTGYFPPDPPPGHGTHRYAFQLFALDTQLSFARPPGRSTLLDEMEGHVLARGYLVGTYRRA